MDNLEQIISDQQNRIQIMEEYISLSLRRREVLSDLNSINRKMEDVKPLVDECCTIIDKYNNIAVDKYKRLINKMKCQQLTMLNIINELKKRKSTQDKEDKTEVVKSFETPTQSRENPNFGSLSSSVRRMYLSDYKQSPFVSKLRPVELQFFDFEARITNKMFESIPSYLRGRTTLEELEAFLDQVIVPCFTEKYQIFYKKRSALRNPQEMTLWGLYREQAHRFPGQKFITQGDISRKLNKTIDKKASGKIAMLRHLVILKELKENTTVFYLWISKSD